MNVKTNDKEENGQTKKELVADDNEINDNTKHIESFIIIITYQKYIFQWPLSSIVLKEIRHRWC